MLDAIFQALFSYRPVVFQQGEFRFDIGTGALVAAVMAGAVMIAAAVTYRRVGGTGRLRDRVVLTTLRMAVLALVLFCLFRPTLIVRAPQSRTQSPRNGHPSRHWHRRRFRRPLYSASFPGIRD